MITPIYKKGSDGKVRSWQYEVEGDKWRTHAGLIDGKKAISSWRTAKPKNVGKKNETTGPEQAAAEAQARLDKQLNREYRRTIEELETVPLGVMLAEKWEDYVDQVPALVASQPKLDGIRAFTSKHGSFTRDFQPHKNAKHIMVALEPFFEKYPNIVFDGELYNHRLKDDFNQISSLVRRQKLTPEQQEKVENLVEYHVYDIAGEGYDHLSFKEREMFLQELAEWTDWGGPLVKVPTNYASVGDELDKLYGWYLDEGYEGQMVRYPHSPYSYDARVEHLLKRKEFVTGEFKIIRVEEGVGNWEGYAKKLRFDFNGKENGAGIRGKQADLKKILEEWHTWDLEKAEVTVRYFKQLTPDGMARFATVVDFHPEGRKD